MCQCVLGPPQRAVAPGPAETRGPAPGRARRQCSVVPALPWLVRGLPARPTGASWQPWAGATLLPSPPPPFTRTQESRWNMGVQCDPAVDRHLPGPAGISVVQVGVSLGEQEPQVPGGGQSHGACTATPQQESSAQPRGPLRPPLCRDVSPCWTRARAAGPGSAPTAAHMPVAGDWAWQLLPSLLLHRAAPHKPVPRRLCPPAVIEQPRY